MGFRTSFTKHLAYLTLGLAAIVALIAGSLARPAITCEGQTVTLMRPSSTDANGTLIFHGTDGRDVILELPTAEVSGPQTPAWEPRWLDRKDERALVRAVERYGNPRDLALIVTLLQTGLQVGKLVAPEPEDVELSPREGVVTVRQGKRDRIREVPLNEVCPPLSWRRRAPWDMSRTSSGHSLGSSRS